MPKTLNLPLRVYEDVVRVSEELSLIAKKPVSTSMAVDLLIEIYRAHLSNPCAMDTFSQQMRNLELMTPEEFDRYWDEPDTEKAPRKKAKSKKK
ncbi:MAG: hypothetical protein NWE96_11970 [Candidatus Bathyarchaeota archaeon]|nr:hypothetical protein [Candidatus Bathyarchaeota archaeon]